MAARGRAVVADRWSVQVRIDTRRGGGWQGAGLDEAKTLDALAPLPLPLALFPRLLPSLTSCR